ncbi:Retrotransposon gag protein [Ceratocystis lukuohia]|uniref:Retrotransposon gag protein n=1 Tax=Ceratocystis lukuohia TaxID=2019550 RepID=A0ABR4M8L1_9PEZI
MDNNNNNMDLCHDGSQESTFYSSQSQFNGPPTAATATPLPTGAPTSQAPQAQTSESPPASQPPQVIYMQQRPRQVLPLLRTFDGDRKKYLDWRLDATNKILIDGEAIGPPLAQLIYIVSCLQGTAKASCREFATRLQGKPNPEVGELFNHLDKTYKDPTARDHHMALLRTPQGNTPFREFFPVFEGHLSQVGGLAWHDDAKISHLTSVMNPDLCTLMSLMGTDDLTFDQYCDLAMRCSMNPRGLKMVTGNARPPPPIPSSGEPMDWTHSYNAHTRPTHDAFGKKFPTDQELKGKRAKWVSAEEIMARRTAKVCLRCPRPGCGTSRCPLLAAINPSRRTGAKANTTQVQSQWKAPDVDDVAEAGDEAKQNSAVISPDGSIMELHLPDAIYKVHPISWYNKAQRPKALMGAVMAAQILRDKRRLREGEEPVVFAATIADIEKALQVKSKTDPKTKVPKTYWEHLGVFEDKQDEEIPHRPGIDLEIRLEKDENGKEKRAPWGPPLQHVAGRTISPEKNLTGTPG